LASTGRQGAFRPGRDRASHPARPGAIEKLRPIVDLRSLAMQGIMPPEELSLCGQARALAQWHENARCCGHCGGTTLVKDGGWRRKCWACGLEWFPRTDPVVIMLISDGERCLLAHEHRYGDKMYSALAGFIEPARTSSTPCAARCWRRPTSRSAR
jgi:NAD+ diphosphatase